MFKNYRTIGINVSCEIIIEKSKFIGTIKKVTSEEEAVSFINEIKRKYWDATHNCSAFLINNNEMRSSDDGEPAGTAGKPILECVKKNNLQNVSVVVTRYFGGIKLGAGGLIRAYTAATQEVIKHAGIEENIFHQSFQLILDYEYWNKIEYFFKSHKIFYEKPIYLDKISVTFYTTEASGILEEIINRGNGSIIINELPSKYLPIQLEKPL
ncbi:YigZ family protein [Pigmentibacter sp. JX0631]|uniref:YigZ family protein n=1 Tax=Pigmentibacter sp. JX0631 TaxID=2976982 RepID=UPI002468704A|nr:YigZ family protein [Pigmentibacter sp. JX0631]WGL59091.1 YigZ family protein [Pigmentibacter sp. JX0631]